VGVEPNTALSAAEAGCLEALHHSAALFGQGEIRASADTALEAGELAKACRRVDLLADAALVVDGVPDPSTAAAVESLCRAALSGSPPLDLARAARLHAQLSVVMHHREEFEEAERHTEAAERLADESGEPRAIAAALNARQLAIAGLGRAGDLLELSERMLRVATASGSVHAELQAHNWRIEALMRQGEPFQTAYEVDALDVLASRSRDRLVLWNARLSRAGLYQAVGRFSEALETATLARHALPDSQTPMVNVYYAAQTALVAIDQATASPEVADLARRMTVGGPMIASAMMGRFHLELGDLASARTVYEAVRRRLGDVPMDRRGLPTLMAAIELGAHFRDEPSVAALRGRLASFDGLLVANALGAVGPVAHFLAVADDLLGDSDAAVAHAQDAVELSARAGFGPSTARARLGLALALHRRAAGPDDLLVAREQAELAVALADQLGMGGVGARAAQLLVELGQRARLTPRERQIAGLVARGSTNRQIAAALFLSERTVDTHVQNILSKLGFHSRAQVAAWVASQGLSAGT
jgi:DNA-binding CsgD family transcriptional regulator